VRAAAVDVPAELVARFAPHGLESEIGPADVLFCADSRRAACRCSRGRHPLVELPPGARDGGALGAAVRFCDRRGRTSCCTAQRATCGLRSLSATSRASPSGCG
jgi:hypothetical protein